MYINNNNGLKYYHIGIYLYILFFSHLFIVCEFGRDETNKISFYVLKTFIRRVYILN